MAAKARRPEYLLRAEELKFLVAFFGCAALLLVLVISDRLGHLPDD